MRRGPVFLVVACLLTAAMALAAEPRVISVQTGRARDTLVCRLETEGLPTDRMRSTLDSGLTSAVDLHLDLLDAKGSVVGGNQVRLRISFDLWAEVFQVRMGSESIRLSDATALDQWLARPPWLPVAPLETLAETGPHRIRAALQIHPIAPVARQEVETLVAGPEGQEVSIGLSNLIRFFYDGGDEDAGDLLGVISSPPFDRKELRDAED